MGSAHVIPEQRQHQILELLHHEPVLSYHQLAETLGVSHMTVRRDAAALAELGRVRLTQGGVAAAHSMGAEPPRRDKATVNTDAKEAISRAAAELVEDSMAIYLDAGTTISAMVPLLGSRRDLTVVTNDLSTATALLGHPGMDLIMVGGRVDQPNHSTVGRLAAQTLAELSLDVAFLSCSSWDAGHGVTTPVEAKIDPKRTAIASASRSVLMADSAKFGSFARHRVLRLTDVDRIITDDGLDPSDAERVAALGVDLVRATVPRPRPSRPRLSRP
ncbi:DeoR/GlpR family DNA-binding transcription regulator [Ornithinicoccus hortensis]|uniref:DeoR family transcriptional regulator n=1 Tax=Ornithinicoccus hortensis TaxID=82346 RepID=A0A542YUN4_9MICO|nr:DeoR/GlpR family DNA-binding transcription regulator [Ornithinicoccus hortensis]TQL51797.1 DeoR family transcriptional regulator [Ornithinicoccus hortensis]